MPLPPWKQKRPGIRNRAPSGLEPDRAERARGLVLAEHPEKGSFPSMLSYNGLRGFKPWMEAADVAGYTAEADTPQGIISFTVNFERENGAWRIPEFWPAPGFGPAR